MNYALASLEVSSAAAATQRGSPECEIAVYLQPRPDNNKNQVASGFFRAPETNKIFEIARQTGRNDGRAFDTYLYADVSGKNDMRSCLSLNGVLQAVGLVKRGQHNVDYAQLFDKSSVRDDSALTSRYLVSQAMHATI